MINLDEKIGEILGQLVAGVVGENGLDQWEARNDIKHLLADYIESIELPEGTEPEAGVIRLDSGVYDSRPYILGVNRGIANCQAKLDEAVKELRK